MVVWLIGVIWVSVVVLAWSLCRVGARADQEGERVSQETLRKRPGGMMHDCPK